VPEEADGGLNKERRSAIRLLGAVVGLTVWQDDGWNDECKMCVTSGTGHTAAAMSDER